MTYQDWYNYANRTAESEAEHRGYQRGVEDERARIVEWLRTTAAPGDTNRSE